MPHPDGVGAEVHSRGAYLYAEQMGTLRTSLFWSYAHDDNVHDHGRILRLADAIQHELALLIESPPSFFVDRTSIGWGDAWRRVIDNALAETAFFVAVATPRYVTRPECRKELLTFEGRARSAGLTELVLPILYVDIPDLDVDSRNEVTAIIARTQWADWTALRIADEASAEYRGAVNLLAVRILELVKRVAEQRVAFDVADGLTPESSENGGLAELIARAEGLWPEWEEAVVAEEVANSQHLAVQRTFSDRRRRLEEQRAGAGVILSTFQEQARATLPLEKTSFALAQVYNSKTIELDPVVQACIDQAKANPAMLPLVDELRTKVEEAVIQIREGSERDAKPDEWIDLPGFLKTMPYVTPIWLEVGRIDAERLPLVEEANEIVLGWATAMDALLGAGPPESR